MIRHRSHTNKKSWSGGIQARTEQGDFVCLVILVNWGDTQTNGQRDKYLNRQQGDLLSLLLFFFSNKEVD